MDKTKSILKSLTAWGGVVMVLPTILKFIGVEASGAEVQSIWDAVMATINSGSEAVGLIMVLVGRFRAGGVHFLGLGKA